MGSWPCLPDLDQWWLLQGNIGLISLAVEELLQRDNLAQKAAHIANVNIEIDCKVIETGSLVMPHYTYTNGNPEQFKVPDRPDITKAFYRHLAFAEGIRYCLGPALFRR